MKKLLIFLICVMAMGYAGISFAEGDWDWFLAPEGTKKEFEIRNPYEKNPVIGKTTEIISEVKTDQFGDKIVKIIFKSSFGQMSTNGYRLYKLDKGTNRVLGIEMYNEQSGLRQTWDDPYPYVIMSLPLTIGKVWNSYEATAMQEPKTERKIIGKEKIKLPAGEFEVFVIKNERMGDMEYYAKGIGIVANKKKNGNNWYWMDKLTKISKQ